MSENNTQKTVLVGVTGCIAAYKSAEIVRGLQKRGHHVKVVMTENACKFVGPVTFRALTNEPVAVGLFDSPSDPIHHISLAKEADIFLIAPCTANVIAKMANGLADDLLTTTALATEAPLVVAPAMNVNMYNHPATQENIDRLKNRGVQFIDADDGYLACGDSGSGRLADPATIVENVDNILKTKKDLEGKKILVTAGPTREQIDPVRFITNNSSGKMGYAIAAAAAKRGAEVILVSGAVDIKPSESISKVIPVVSADQMYDAVDKVFDDCHAAFFVAAVSDMRPAKRHDSKLKKGRDDSFLSNIELTHNKDILKSMGTRKKNQIVIGFAAETESLIENAKEKLNSKNADYIIANDVSGGAVFEDDQNKISIVSEEEVKSIPAQDKTELAHIILDATLRREY